MKWGLVHPEWVPTCLQWPGDEPPTNPVSPRSLTVNLGLEQLASPVTRVQEVPSPWSSTLQVFPLIPKIVTPKLKMPMINFLTFDLSGHAHDFMEKFYNFRVTHGLINQQIISLLLTHLIMTALGWYTADVGKAPLVEYNQLFVQFWKSICWGASWDDGSNAAQYN